MQNNTVALFAGSPSASSRIWTALQSEERPSHMLFLIAVLVLLLHLWALSILVKSDEAIVEAKPLPMQVSMVTIPVDKPVVEPPKPLPPPPKVTQPKPLVKPVVKKTAPVQPKAPAAEIQKAPDFAPFEPFKPSPPQQSTPPANTSSPSAPANASSAAESNAQPFTEANFKANYAHNPKPDYPAIAKSRGWQGKVLLRVKVSVEGLSDSVTVEKSSDHEILDDAAIEAVKKWRFVPAKRGDTPVASSVIVPIDFKLR